MVVNFSANVSAGDVRWLIGQLKGFDKELYNQMRRDFRKDIRPFARDLSAGIPPKAPVSGLAPNSRFARQSVDERAPYVWKKPSALIDVASRTRGRRGGKSTENVVRIRYNDKRPYSAFSVLERANRGRLNDAVSSRYSRGDRGRWVIPQFYKKQGEMVQVAGRILNNYAKRFSFVIARRLS